MARVVEQLVSKEVNYESWRILFTILTLASLHHHRFSTAPPHRFGLVDVGEELGHLCFRLQREHLHQNPPCVHVLVVEHPHRPDPVLPVNDAVPRIEEAW